MKKRFICLLCTIFALTGLIFAPQNTYADPVTDTETSITAPENNSTDSTENSGFLDQETDVTCYDQVGAIGWLVCPTTGFLAKAIDGIYGVIQNFLNVTPLSTDTDSPIYLVWEYIRNITNIVFIIFLLVVIYSQLTGVGITNYGIKKTLPRILVVAILVNLSYLICALAVDASNILGASLGHVFTSIQESAAGGEVHYYSVYEVVGSILKGGGLAGLGITAAVATGSLWLLIPVVFSGIVAVIAAFLTLAARQAIIVILIMIAPLAFVAYLLPNTEKWFGKWRDLLLQMLIFYPMFSVLFGASQLAGWAIIASAGNGINGVFSVILGIAVQILPLFFAFSLLKTSNAILGKVNELSRRPFAPAQKGVAAWADSQRAHSKQKYQVKEANKYDLPRRLTKALADAKTKREQDTETYAARNKSRGQRIAATSVYGRDGKFTKRGDLLYSLRGKEQEDQAAIKKITGDLDEGIGEDRARNNRHREQLRKTSAAITRASDQNKDQDARLESIKLSNLEKYATRVTDANEFNALVGKQRRGEVITEAERTRLAQLQAAGKAEQRYADIEVASGKLGSKGINNIVATAISMQEKSKQEATDNYTSLFDATRYTADINKKYLEALATGDENAVAAAIQVLVKRGDTDMVAEGLELWTPSFIEDTPQNYAMQKRISDTTMTMKQDAAQLAAFAKATNVVRAKALARREKIEKARVEGTYDASDPEYAEIAEYGSFQEFMSDSGVFGQLNLGITGVLNEYSDNVVPSQDRTVYKYLRENGVLGFRMKDYRSGLTSGLMEGERLETATEAVIGSSKKEVRGGLSADQRALAEDRIREFVSEMSASQVMGFKSTTVDLFATALGVGDDPEERRRDGLERLAGMIDSGTVSSLRKRAARGNIEGMNIRIRDDLDSILHFMPPEDDD